MFMIYFLTQYMKRAGDFKRDIIYNRWVFPLKSNCSCVNETGENSVVGPAYSRVPQAGAGPGMRSRRVPKNAVPSAHHYRSQISILVSCGLAYLKLAKGNKAE
jgi:hypothetical protein